MVATLFYIDPLKKITDLKKTESRLIAISAKLTLAAS